MHTQNLFSGIPTPNLSGILTGIKPLPLFSLPGVRIETKPEEKPVSFILGIPSGSYSKPCSRPSTTSIISTSTTSSLPYSSLVHPSVYPSCVNLPSHLTNSPTQYTQPVLSNTAKPALSSSYPPVSVGQLEFIKPSDSLPTLLSPIPPRERHLSAPSPRSPKPDSQPTKDKDLKRPQSLPLGGPLSLKKNITLSVASLISPETPRCAAIFYSLKGVSPSIKMGVRPFPQKKI